MNHNPHNGNSAPARKQKFARPVKPEDMNRMSGTEDRGRRTRSSKMFSLGRGLYQAVMYPDPVHFTDKKTGELAEIDNTLIPVTDTAGCTFLTNRCNDELKVEFHNTQDTATILLENENGRILAWKLENALPVQPRVVNTERPIHSDDDLRRTVLDKLEGEVIYEDILPGVSMNCSVQSLSFKDFFTFNSFADAQPISFLISMPDMIPERQANGSVQIIAPTGEVAFTLPRPYMQDSATEANFGSVSVVLEPAKEPFTWRMTYLPDMEWLASAHFPVVLDPAVITKESASAIEDNFVSSKHASTSQDYAGTGMTVSYASSNWGTSRAFIKFLDSGLPDIDSSYYITKAYFNVKTKTDPTTSASVYLKEALASWNSQTITYDNAPALHDKALDYQFMESDETWYTYDISNLVRKWYNGQNYGFALESITNTYLSLYTSDHAYHKPYVVINYTSLAGLEDYLVYEDQDVGRAGVGHVSLYNGNLIFERQDTSCSGNRMPVSVSHIYNSCYRNVTAFGAGAGWKMNVQQTLHKEILTDAAGDTTYYVYMDEDGTRHHFKSISGEWVDQSGKGMTLTISGSTATITDKGHNSWVFDLPTKEFADNYANVKMLKTLSDACGNTMTVTTAGCILENVQDGISRDTSFSNTNNRVNTIYSPGYGESGACGFEYDANGRLTHVWEIAGQPGTEDMYYDYDDATGLLISATNCDDVKVTYEYYTEREPYRVKRVRITGGNLCAYDRTYEYKDCLTVVTDNLSGKQLFYHFNDNGNCVSVNDQLGYACFAQYSDEYPVNHPETISKMQRAIVNFLAGHNMEASGSWTNANLSGTGTYSYATDAYYMGVKSLKMAKTNSTGLMTSYQTVTLPKGKTYTFSSYFKTLSDAAAQLRVTYKNSAGSDVTIDSETKTNTSAWDRISLPFTLPEDSASDSVTVRLMAANGTGSVWFDCAQLEEGPVANRYNMLINGDFSFDSGATPSGWLANSHNVSADKVYTTCTGTKPQGLSTNTMRLYGGARHKYTGIYQDIQMTGSEGDVYVAGGWSFNYSQPRRGENEHKRYNIRVAFLKSGTSSTRENAPSIGWSEEWTDWQFAAGPVIAPCDYTSIRFNLDYERNINYAEFNGLFLHKEEFGQTYVYDSDGNVLSAKNAASLKDGATYDDFDNILTYYQPGRSSSVKTTMEWGTTDAEKKKHLLRKSTSPLGIVKEFSYDTNGNQTSSTIRSGTYTMNTSATYTDNGNHIAIQVDPRGKKLQRITNNELDTIVSVIDPRGQTVNYSYDQNRKLTKVSAIQNNTEYSNEYVYFHDRLSALKHTTATDDVIYHFSYDALGRPTVVSVGNQPLTTTVYNADGSVNSIAYGNGSKAVSNYDEYKRVVGMKYDNESTDHYSYIYGANGTIAQIKDNISDITITCEYDAANRPMRKTTMASGEHVYTGEAVFDEFNNIALFNEKVGTDRTEYCTTFTYDIENRPTLLEFGNSHNATFTYDGLGRISTRAVNLGATTIDTIYGYLPGPHGTGSTTPLVQTITQSGTTLTYAYDDAGNITSVSDGSKIISYEYDLLGQLTRVNDPYDTTAGTSGTTWKYAYDQGGNIQSKTAYAFTTGTVGAAVKTDSFTYGDTNWKDKLTAFNGQTITYDEIGNPTNDGIWSYTWAKGRQLQSISKNGEHLSFTYNHDGLRTTKTSTTTGTTTYIMHGKCITHLTNGNHQLHFFYDHNNIPSVVEYNGIAYSYLHNLQGDVIALVDSTGEKVVEYKYDSWGKPLTTTGSLATTLGFVNPFRYRGYVYDEETGLYYLRSRYYNPASSRFLNADWALGERKSILGKNSFCYCTNNPICRADSDGCISFWKLLGKAAGALCSVVEAATSFITDGIVGLAAWAAETAIIGATTWVLGGIWMAVKAASLTLLGSVCVFAWVAIPIVVAGFLGAVCIKNAILAQNKSQQEINDEVMALAYDELVNKGNEYFWCVIMMDPNAGEAVNAVFTLCDDVITLVTDQEIIDAIVNSETSEKPSAPIPSSPSKRPALSPSRSPSRFSQVCVMY